jgi:membrane protease YdiL (CAAX protease family)
VDTATDATPTRTPPTSAPATAPGAERDRQARRLAVAVACLAVVWFVAFNATDLAFFPVVTAGGVLTGLVGLWVRRVPDAAAPGYRLTPRVAAVAVLVALVHFAVGHVLFAAAARVVPAMAATALEAYDRAGSIPLWGQLLLGALVTAGMEEVFWRGAFTPIVTDRLRRRLPQDMTPVRQGVVLVLVSTAGYALFHVATLKLAIVAAALLGGLVWGALLLATRSLGATIIAHVLWTGLMLAFPPSLPA